MMQYWSWLLAVIGVTGIFLVGRKTIWGWLILCVNEALWIAYALVTKQYGFIAMAVAYAAIYIKSYIHWKREESEAKEMYNEIYTHGQIDHKYIK
jgi:nicotinamide riboside transporter PnuC